MQAHAKIFILISALTLTLLTSIGCKTLTLPEELATLPPAERKAFDSLIAEAGVTTDKIRSVGLSGLDNFPLSVAIYKGHIAGLRLSDTSLTHMDELQNLPALERAWLSGNKITAITGLTRMPNLTELVLDKNQIASITGLEGCIKLEKLRLIENRIETLNGIQNAPILQELDLSGNQVRDFSALAGNRSIVILTLSRNQLTAPAGISHMLALTTLNLDNNQLTTLAGMEDLPKLTTLNVSHNQIKDLEAITEFPDLTTIDISYNAVTSMPTRKPKREWDLKLEGNPRPANWVAERPGYSWSGSNMAGDESSGTPIGSGNFEFTGMWKKVNGVRPAILPTADNAHGNNVTLEISVETGRVRAYLVSPPGEHFNSKVGFGRYGYNYGEATPGKTAIIKGDLDYGGGANSQASFVFESLDGEAGGVRYRVWRK